MHARRIYIEQSLDVALGLARNSDNRIGHLQCGFLDPK